MHPTTSATPGAAAALSKSAKTISNTADHKPNSKGKAMKKRNNKPPAAILFGEEAARIVALQVLASIHESLNRLALEAFEHWDEEQFYAIALMEEAVNQCKRAKAVTSIGNVVGDLNRLAATIAGIHALRPGANDYSARVLQAMPQELATLSGLIEGVQMGERFIQAEG